MPKRYWKEVLPIMGFYLGKKPKGKMLNDYNNKTAKYRLEASGLFPKAPLISDEEWEAINSFYNNNSPENLPKETPPILNTDVALFKKEVLPWKSGGDGVTYLNFDENEYHIGFNTEKESFYIKLDGKGNVLQNHQLNYPLVDVIKNGEVELLLSMGRMFNVDEPTGSVLVLADKPRQFIGNLERPVDFLVEDFDKDGNMDILVAEFGKYLGGIHTYTRKNTIEKTNIHPKPGAVKFVLRDVNNDGLKDFYALVAQEDESIYLFVNKGGLKFEKQQLLTLPSYYGTTHFELLDFDNDGDEDIICSSGDSDDFASALKPYHGVRLFENLGENNFNQVWFHKQEGAYGTACADYDNDGDIDIASIGYYASLQHKDEEGFLYFENVSTKDEKWKFKTYAFPNTSNNCFMLVKAKDIDDDGDMDILLGSNSSIFSGNRKQEIDTLWERKGGVITILKNTSK
ncbi:VCBS repeat-containing protein [Algibacter sp. 2305UL17-15]|uniref:FG-GAP repeat domain-containing protein n=1 Tax=Algibacter sp. 2305UL17-15 TaxID=3231268 RepID=UPI00345B4BE4